jgi:3-phenylpropionate/trans-cinnamate dioxygenase ferredoxin reductase subunit
LAGAVSIETLRLRDSEWLASHGIDCLLSRVATRIVPETNEVEFADESSLSYDRLLLATGSCVRKLNIQGSDLEHVHYLRTAQESDALRETLMTTRHLVIVGAGFIGLEVAATARETFNCQVTVVEAGSGILQRAAPDRLREMLLTLHGDNGVEFRFDAEVERFGGSGAVDAVHLKDGESFAADAVLICVGVQPNIKLAVDAGINVATGILTDNFGQTSMAGIYAAGEVAEHVNEMTGSRVRYESWQMAQLQADIVGANISGEAVPISYVPWFWTDQYGHNFQMLGRTDSELRQVVRTYNKKFRSTTVYFEGRQAVGALCVNSGGDVSPIRKAIMKRSHADDFQLANPEIKIKRALVAI